jgi:RecT family
MENTMDQTPLTKRDLVDQNIAKVFPTPPIVGISETSGALVYRTMGEVIEAAKMMAMSGPAVPRWLQGNPGGCWAIIIQASQWRLDPISVARMSYCVASQDGGESIGYMSQLVHALVEARAPITHRLRFRFEGEGEERRCVCVARVRGEVEPIEHATPPLGLITPKRSPLWKSDPDQQLSYYAARAMCRRHFPDILMGVYDRDELEGEVIDHPGGGARDVTSAAEELQKRLAEATSNGGDKPIEGFSGLQGVDAGLGIAGATAEPKGEPEAADPAPDAPQPAKPNSARAKPKAAPPPKTARQYTAHVAAWLPHCTTEEEIEERWRVEMKLRNVCGVTSEQKQEIRATLIDQRIAGLRVGG